MSWSKCLSFYIFKVSLSNFIQKIQIFLYLFLLLVQFKATFNFAATLQERNVGPYLNINKRPYLKQLKNPLYGLTRIFKET